MLFLFGSLYTPSLSVLIIPHANPLLPSKGNHPLLSFSFSCIYMGTCPPKVEGGEHKKREREREREREKERARGGERVEG